MTTQQMTRIENKVFPTRLIFDYQLNQNKKVILGIPKNPQFVNSDSAHLFCYDASCPSDYRKQKKSLNFASAKSLCERSKNSR